MVVLILIGATLLSFMWFAGGRPDDKVGWLPIAGPPSLADWPNATPVHPGPASESFTTAPSSERSLALLRFTADWCPPCVEMDRRVFSRPDMARFIRQHATPLAVDLTNPTEGQMAIAERYAALYLPLFVLIDREGNEHARLVGEADTESFQAWLAQSVAATDAASLPEETNTSTRPQN